jgi:NADH-quinone oxidoreductase subunit N
MVVTLSIFLLSLLGIPPLVGFAAKFQIFLVLFNDGQAYYQAGEPGLGATLLGLLVVAGLNTVLSAFYYLKVMKVMILDHRTEDLEGTEPTPLREPISAVAYAVFLSLVVLGLGIFWEPMDRWSRTCVARLRLKPGEDLARATLPTTALRMGGGPGGGGGPPAKKK